MEVQAIVDELAQAVRRPITLEDAGGRLLAYSVHDQPVDMVRVETLLRKGASSVTLEALRNRGVYQFVDASSGLARVPPIPEIGFASRICVAIRGPERVLGYLWVADGDSSLPRSAEEALLRTRHILAQELVKRDSALVAKQEQRAELIEDLCGREQRDDESLGRRAKALGWYPTAPFQVIVVRGEDGSFRASSLLIEAEDLFGQHCPSCLRGPFRDEAVAIISGREVSSSGDVAAGIAELLKQQGYSGVVGAGGLYENLSQVRRSYMEASAAISLGARMKGESRHFDYGTLAPYELLSCMATCRKAGAYGRDQVEKVSAYDNLHGGNLLLTLEAFLDFYGRRKEAASRLNIHPNTLDYRVRKVRELTGMDLDDPNARLVAHIWVKALRWAAKDKHTLS